MAAGLSKVHFVGRLATYKYYNMDQVVAQALTLFLKLREREQPNISGIHEETHEPAIARAVGGN
jgi:UDP-galactopyranose mutase